MVSTPTHDPAYTLQTRPAHEMYTGADRVRVEEYLSQLGILPPYDPSFTEAQWDTLFDEAFLRRSEEARLLQYAPQQDAPDILTQLIFALFGILPTDDWQEPATSGLSGPRFANLHERAEAQARAAVTPGNVVPVEVEPGTLSASSLVENLMLREIGIREQGKNCGADVARYGEAAGIGTGLPWCASFVSYIYARAGVDVATDGVGGTASALAFREQFAAKGAFHGFSETGADGTPRLPEPGDTVVFSRNGPSSGQGHVGIVFHVDAEKGTITLVEGNSGDQVKQNTYKLADLREGKHGALGFGSIDKITEQNPRFAARGQERVTLEPVAEITPAHTPNVIAADATLKRS